jgi:hypothetical protein
MNTEEKLAELARMAERAAARKSLEPPKVWNEPVTSMFNERYWACEVCDNFDWEPLWATEENKCRVCGNVKPVIWLAA